MPLAVSSPRTALFTLAEVLEATGGKLYSSHPKIVSALGAPVHTDTRTLQPGDWFLALVGDNFDGHAFLEAAIAQVCLNKIPSGGLIISKPQALLALQIPEALTVVIVPDTLAAYLALGRHHRLRHPQTTVVAITGSSGKTTTKELLLSALLPWYCVQATALNHNNEVGVAQTLCSLAPDTDVLIVEMGMRGLGQIEPLSQAACPNVAAIINIGPAHIGLLGSLEAIAQAKSEIVTGLSTIPSRLCPQPTVVIPNNSPLLWDTTRHTPSRILEAALAQAAIVPSLITAHTEQVQQVQHSVQGTSFQVDGVTIALVTPGQHLVENTLVVLAVGHALGLTTAQLAAGLAAYQPVKGRWEPTWFQASSAPVSPSCLIQDAYNANPVSMLASLQTLEGILPSAARCLLVLAGMKELGHLSVQYHQALGQWLVSSRLIHHSDVILLGEEMDATREVLVAAGWNPVCYLMTGPPCDEVLKTLVTDCQQLLTKEASPCWALLKGSRYYRLDALGASLLEHVVLVENNAFVSPDFKKEDV